MKENELYATLLRQRAEDHMKHTTATDFEEYEINILKLQHELEVFQIELQMQYEEIVKLTAIKEELTAELLTFNLEMMNHLEEKDKLSDELLKKTSDLQLLSSHHTNREIKLLKLEEEIVQLLKKRDNT